MFSSQFDLNYFILMIILRHGGEWPDWGDPYGQILAGAVIGKIAGQIRDEQLRMQLNKIAVEVMSSQAGRMLQK